MHKISKFLSLLFILFLFQSTIYAQNVEIVSTGTGTAIPSTTETTFLDTLNPLIKNLSVDDISSHCFVGITEDVTECQQGTTYSDDNIRFDSSTYGWYPKNTSILTTLANTDTADGTYIEFNFGETKNLKRFDIKAGYSNQWVTSYKVSYSTNGSTWQFYSIDGGISNFEFPGNADGTSTVSKTLDAPINAKYIRVYPLGRQTANYAAMRFEAYEEKDACVFDDGNQVGTDQIATCITDNKTVFIKNSSDNSTNDDININTNFSFTSGDVRFLADRDINIKSNVSVSGTASLMLNSDTNTTYTDPFTETTSDAIRTALNTKGRVRVDLDDAGFNGKIDFTSSGNLFIDDEEYILVSDFSELQSITSTLSGNYALANDITDATSTTTSTINGTFTGKLNGLGHKIDNLVISGAARMALFRDFDGATASNLGITNVDITSSTNYVGALAGDSTGATVFNTYATGNITSGTGLTGGLIGNLAVGNNDLLKTLIDNSFTKVDINTTGAATKVGGLIGSAVATSRTLILNNTYAINDVQANAAADNFGGLVGIVTGTKQITILDSYALGNINSKNPIDGDDDIGGFIGYASAYILIDKSFARGNVFGNDDVGGFIGNTTGHAAASPLKISHSYSSGDVVGYDYDYVTTSDEIGGFIGALDDAADTTIENSFTTSKVSSKSTESGALFGSLNANITVSNVYWNSSSNLNKIGTYNTTTVTGDGNKTLTQIASLTDANLGSAGAWTNTTNLAHPILQSLPVYDRLNSYASNIINVTITSGSAGSATPVDGVYVFDDDATIGIDTLNTALGLGKVVIKSGGNIPNEAGDININIDISSLANDLEIIANGDININNALSFSANNLLLKAGKNLNINNTITPSGAVNLTLNANEDKTDDSNLFTQTTKLDVRTAVETIGRVKMDLDSNGFNSKVDFTSSGVLTINNEIYTLISNFAELQNIKNTGLSANYALSNDITDAIQTTVSTINGTFTGKLNGLGHVINNLDILGAAKLGLSQNLNGATVSNIGITNLNITSSGANAGALTGSSTGATIFNTYATGKITSATGIAGGLVGSQTTSTNTIYQNTYSNVNITTTGVASKVGGFIGSAVGSKQLIILDSYSLGDVISLTQTDLDDNIGGFIGYAKQYITIDKSFSRGNVSGNDNVGGFIGNSLSQSISLPLTISNSYSTGDVFGYDYDYVTDSDEIGGLIGEIDAAAFTTIENSFTTSKVTSKTTESGALFGSLNADITVSNVYYNTDSNTNVSGTYLPKIITGAMPKTLTQIANLTDANFDSTGAWTNTGDLAHPILQSLPVYDRLNSYASNIINVTITSGSAGSATPVDGVYVFDDDATIGIDTLNTALGLGKVVIKSGGVLANEAGNITINVDISSLSNDLEITADGDITINNVVSYSSNSLILKAASDINIKNTLTPSGSASLTLNSNNNIINDTDPFTKTTADSVRTSLETIGRVKVELADDGFNGKVNFISTTGTLTIDDEEYTIISSFAELQAISSTLDGNFALANDITDATETSLSTVNGIFTGKLNGLGHKVDNVSINSTSTSATTFGLFKTLANSTVSNLAITNINQTIGDDIVGSLAGSSTGATVFNTYATGKLTSAKGSTGGLVGVQTTTTNALFENTYTNIDITTTGVSLKVGGLIGSSIPTIAMIISNSYATGFVDGGSGAGGFIGTAKSIIANNFWILDSYATGNVNENKQLASNDNVGGFIGYVESQLNIDNCFATGFVYGNTQVGGFIGYAYKQIATTGLLKINNSYSSGNVYGFDTDSTDNIGGFIGYLNVAANAYISNAFSYGIVTDKTDNSGALFGTITGTPNLTNIYYNSDANSSVGTGTLNDATALAKADFEDVGNLTGFDSNIWNTTNASIVYPILTGLDQNTQISFALIPTISLNAISNLGKTATVNLTINANASISYVTIEYGKDTTYGNEITLQQNFTGTNNVTVSQLLGNLDSSTTYHYRAVAKYANDTKEVVTSDDTFTTIASNQINVTITSGSNGTYTKSANICTFDTDVLVGIDTIAQAYGDTCDEIIIRTGPNNAAFVTNKGKLNFDTDLTLTGTQKLTLIADHDLNIQAILTAQDNSNISLKANNYTTGDDVAINSESNVLNVDLTRAALETIGRVRVTLKPNSSEFLGKVNFEDRSGDDLLIINDEPYTVINSFSSLDGMPISNTTRYALGHDLDLSSSTITATIVAGEFLGKFDGLGNSIKNARMSNNTFFQELENGSILRNTNFKNIFTTTNFLAGASANPVVHNIIVTGSSTGSTGIIGSVTSGLFDMIYTDASFDNRSTSGVGGFARIASGNVVLNNLYINGNIKSSVSTATSTQNSGGMIGSMSGNSNGRVIILDSYVNADINSNLDGEALGINTGGILGYFNTTNVTGILTIDNVAVLSDIRASNAVGGFVGAVGVNGTSPTEVHITNSYFSGNILSDGAATGLMIGINRVNASKVTIEDSFTYGNIVTTDVTDPDNPTIVLSKSLSNSATTRVFVIGSENTLAVSDLEASVGTSSFSEGLYDYPMLKNIPQLAQVVRSFDGDITDVEIIDGTAGSSIDIEGSKLFLGQGTIGTDTLTTALASGDVIISTGKNNVVADTLDADEDGNIMEPLIYGNVIIKDGFSYATNNLKILAANDITLQNSINVSGDATISLKTDIYSDDYTNISIEEYSAIESHTRLQTQGRIKAIYNASNNFSGKINFEKTGYGLYSADGKQFNVINSQNSLSEVFAAATTENIAFGKDIIATDDYNHNGASTTGDIDGIGHVIKNLHINKVHHAGLVYEINQARIRNLGLVDIDSRATGTSTYSYAGTFAGQSTNSLFHNIFATGNLTSKDAVVGGLVAESSGKTLFDTVYTNLEIVLTNSVHAYGAQVGGILGLTNASPLLVYDASAHGDITSNNDKVGGLIGASNPQNYGKTIKINQSFSTGILNKGQNNISSVGGIIGKYTAAVDNTKVDIANTFTTAEVYGETGVGGIIGSVNPNKSSFNIQNVYATGDIEASSGSAGGIIGASGATFVNLVVDSVFSFGDISGVKTGGIVGSLSSATNTTFTNNFWLEQDSAEGTPGAMCATGGSECTTPASNDPLSGSGELTAAQFSNIDTDLGGGTTLRDLLPENLQVDGGDYPVLKIFAPQEQALASISGDKSVLALQEILEDSNSTNGAQNANGENISLGFLKEIVGLTNIIDEYIVSYQSAFESATGFSDPTTPAQVQTIIDTINNQESSQIIENYATNGQITPTVGNYIGYNITGVDEDTLSGINWLVESQESEDVDSVSKLQNVIDNYVNIFDYSKTAGTSTSPSLENYQVLGLNNLAAHEIDAFNELIKTKTASELNTKLKLELLIAQLHAEVNIIESGVETTVREDSDTTITFTSGNILVSTLEASLAGDKIVIVKNGDTHTSNSNINILDDFTYSKNHLKLIADKDINIAAKITPTGTSLLTLNANTNETDTNIFDSTFTSTQTRDALNTIGRVRVGLKINDSEFLGKVDFANRTGNDFLIINEEAYTVINTFTALDTMPLMSTTRYALGKDLADFEVTGNVVGGIFKVFLMV